MTLSEAVEFDRSRMDPEVRKACDIIETNFVMGLDISGDEISYITTHYPHVYVRDGNNVKLHPDLEVG